jgi:hypothetical protein
MEIFISLKNVARTISQPGRDETQMLPFIKHELAYYVGRTNRFCCFHGEAAAPPCHIGRAALPRSLDCYR